MHIFSKLRFHSIYKAALGKIITGSHDFSNICSRLLALWSRFYHFCLIFLECRSLFNFFYGRFGDILSFRLLFFDFFSSFVYPVYFYFSSFVFDTFINSYLLFLYFFQSILFTIRVLQWVVIVLRCGSFFIDWYHQDLFFSLVFVLEFVYQILDVTEVFYWLPGWLLNGVVSPLNKILCISCLLKMILR
jgi:hypothetical protein